MSVRGVEVPFEKTIQGNNGHTYFSLVRRERGLRDSVCLHKRCEAWTVAIFEKLTGDVKNVASGVMPYSPGGIDRTCTYHVPRTHVPPRVNAKVES